MSAAILIGLLLRDVIPPADAWIVRHWYAAPGSPAANIATSASGIGTLLALAAVIAGATALLVRGQRGRRLGLAARGRPAARGAVVEDTDDGPSCRLRLT